ncbi:MAG TPA: PAS domain S-box protein [Lacunisphaera sp.]
MDRFTVDYANAMAFFRINSPLKLTLAYVIFGLIWIVGSDGFVAWQLHEEIGKWAIDSGKGLLFIGVTGGLLYTWSKRLVGRSRTAEAALRESQLRWQFALEGAGDGLWDWDLGADRVFFSRQWKSMLGYAEGEIGDGVTEWETRVHPDDLATAWAKINQHLRAETTFYLCEHRLRTKNGAYKWILARGKVVDRAPDGQPRRMIGTHTDITERRSAEARVADALGFAKALLNSSPIGVIAYGPAGQAVMANEAAARTIGADLPGLLRQNFRELESWRRYGLLAAAEKALASGTEVVHQGPLVTSFGRSLWIEARFMPFTFQDSRHLLLLLNDMTEARRTLDNLHLMDAAVQAAPLGWVVVDSKGCVEWTNPGFTTLTGYTAQESVGRNLRFLKSGRHTSEFYQEMWATITRGEIWFGEMMNQRKDGTPYNEHMTIVPVRNTTGVITHFVAIKKDITGQKQLEHQLARAQRLESIGMLASGIAHDLNNIFAPIMLSLELLKLKYPASDDRRMLDLVESAARRGGGIVRQVLTFARGTTGERVELQPHYLVKEAVQILGETLPRNIRIVTELGAGLLPVMGDATQLNQVILNLAVNARDAMPDGGRLTVGLKGLVITAEKAARNPPLVPGPCVALTVTDTGTGIPDEVLEHMFEPFYTTKPRGKGTGLGLSTVYGIVRSHGGAIEVATKPGFGTTFTVLLPACDRGTEQTNPPPPMAAAFAGAGRRVLVVDDEEAIRSVTQEALQRHGFVVELANDGATALELLRTDPTRFAIVLTDLMMPSMGGRELARAVRDLTLTTPIIASSGLSEEPAPHENLAELGIRTILNKPYAEAELLAALRQELESK